MKLTICGAINVAQSWVTHLHCVSMASKHDIIGEEWRERATELADWAMLRLVNRKDVWGQYSVPTPSEVRDTGRTYKAMTLPAKAQRGGDKVTLDKLTRHFASRRLRKPQLIGLHAKSKDTTSRWFGLDIDCHKPEEVGAEDLARRNLNGVLSWYRKLQNMGFDPMLFDSNGAGGFHLWVLFNEPAPTQQVFDFAQWLIADWQELQLDKLPETFPKNVKQDSLGSWFRLPGLHHTRDHYSAVWAGDDGLDDPWLTGHAAIDTVLANIPGPYPAIPGQSKANSNQIPAKPVTVADAEPGNSPPPRSDRQFARTQKPRVCVDLDGVLAARVEGDAIGPPIDGAVEFTRDLSQRADLIIFTARFSTRSTKARSAESVNDLEQRIIKWLDAHGFSYDSVNTSQAKPIASAYVDDRAISCQPLKNGLDAFNTALQDIDALCHI